MKKYKRKELKESEKILYKLPQQKQEVVDKINEVKHNQNVEFYSYDEYASGIMGVFYGNINFYRGALIIRKNSNEYISFNLNQSTACEYFVESNRYIFDFKLKSHGTATLIV